MDFIISICSTYVFRRTTTTTIRTTTAVPNQENSGILARIVNGISQGIGTLFNGGSLLAAAGNPLFGSVAIGRKKREDSKVNKR